MASRCSPLSSRLRSTPLISAPRAVLSGVMFRLMVALVLMGLAVPGHQLALQRAQAHLHGESDEGNYQNPQHHYIRNQKLRGRLDHEARPLVAAINSAATSVDQPTPRPMRTPVRMSGRALGRITWRISCQRVAPSDCAARSFAGSTVRTPVAVEMAIGAKIAR